MAESLEPPRLSRVDLEQNSSSGPFQNRRLTDVKLPLLLEFALPLDTGLERNGGGGGS